MAVDWRLYGRRLLIGECHSIGGVQINATAKQRENERERAAVINKLSI